MKPEFPKLHFILRGPESRFVEMFERYHADPWGHEGRLDLARERARASIERELRGIS